MKTLGFLLLLAVGLGAAYWTTQRPGEGLDALRDEGRTVVDRLSGAAYALRDTVYPALPDIPPTVAAPSTRAAETPAPVAAAPVNEALDERIAVLENGLTRTMSMAESSAVQDRLDALEARLVPPNGAESGPSDVAPDAAPDGARDVAARLATLAERIDSAVQLLDQRLDGQEGDRLALEDRMAAQRSSSDARARALGARLNALAGSPSSSPGDGAAADGGAPPGAASVLDARLSVLEDALTDSRSTSTGVIGLRTRIDAIDDRLLALADNDARIEETLARLEGSLGAATGVATDGVDGVDASPDATRQRVRELESQLDGLPAPTEADSPSRRTQDALERQIAALEQRIETLGEGSDPALISSIDAVRQQVDQLSASGFVTQDELRSRTEGKHVEYKIYFDNNATTVSDGAARVLDSFIAQETNRATGVAIYGFTDRQGSAVYNRQLAQQRAANVRSYLVQNGFDYTRIDNVAGLGEDAAAVLLEDEQEDAQQRVVVLFASQP